MHPLHLEPTFGTSQNFKSIFNQRKGQLNSLQSISQKPKISNDSFQTGKSFLAANISGEECGGMPFFKKINNINLCISLSIIGLPSSLM